MSSAPNQQLPRISNEVAASHEDLELFRRLLRVARFVQAHDIDDFSLYGNISTPPCADKVVGNQDPSLTQYSCDNGADGGFLRPGMMDNTTSIGNATRIDNDYDKGDDDEYDEDEDEEVAEAEEDSRNAAAILSQPAGLGNKAPQIPQLKQSNNQQHNTRAAAQRQCHQQQQPQRQQRTHAAVEKRYRSVVNSKIQQLSAIIPASDTFSLIDPNLVPEDQGAGVTQKVPSKSVVLDRAIQHINHLVSTYQQCETDRNELRRKLQLWLDETSSLR